jgi:hypothetical protein
LAPALGIVATHEKFLTDVLRVALRGKAKRLMRATTMNTTTFTIESVHGVKQTLVLNPPVKTAENSSTDQQSGGDEREADAKNAPTASRSPR